MKTVYLALGANIGERERNLARALDALETGGVHIVRRSSLYETEPRDLRDQPWFLNLVVETETSLLPRQLLSTIRRIEKNLGRKRVIAKGPRTIDIDILLFGRFVVDTPELQIPHPRLHERRFVLEPLAELAPELRHPITHRSAREMLGDVMDQQVRRVVTAP
ncbi:MAG TPA: 2-amino-4-hydroxy-6-hydroxymethyldihydropteridine diphosphokinase [Bryobacteraceae bacterium]|nr:2-amino-4-hydroxy-6-hydroxymethyldihydropteridine diphosphokinase [Bryobacteraceae bacterium]